MTDPILNYSFMAIDLAGAIVAWAVVRITHKRRSFDHAVAMFFSASLILSWIQATVPDFMFFEAIGWLIYNGMSLNWMAAKLVLVYLATLDLVACLRARRHG